MTEQYTYWFVRLKKIDDSSDSFSNNIEDRVFCIEKNDSTDNTRELAKKYCVDNFGNLPFRKPKTANKDDKYFYLVESNKYWFDFHNKEHNLVCENCHKSYVRIGDTAKSKLWNVQGKNICSAVCNLEYSEKLRQKYNNIDNENYWISDDAHPLTEQYGKSLVGYIYRITNKNTMLSYIGKTIKPPLFRWWQHLSVDKKFEQEDLTQLVFEVLEVVYIDNENKNNETLKTKILSEREHYHIDYYSVVDEGYNKIK